MQTSHGKKSWQKAKSENTKTLILEATLDCFMTLGYNNTTTEKVASKAGVSRGAMLHHFPQRSDLIHAAVLFLHKKRLELFHEQLTRINFDAKYSQLGEGIDSFWGQLKSPLFTIFCELQLAARTDAELKSVLGPATREYQRSWLNMAVSIFPDFALSEKFMMANRITVFLLEGMAMDRAIEGEAKREEIAEQVISWLKTALREMFRDVEGIDRESAKKETHQLSGVKKRKT